MAFSVFFRLSPKDFSSLLHILIAQVNTSLAAEVPFRLADGHGRPFVQLMGGS